MAPLLLIMVLAAGLPAQAAAQTAPAASVPAAPAQTVTPQPPPPTEYRVGPQDLLNITVFGEPTLSGKFHVDSDGRFLYQYLGRVKADDLTVTQIGETIRKGLADGYLRNPQVSVEIEQYHSQNVYVLGEVRAPNKYSLPGNLTLIDLLTLAGSTTPTAGHWVLINHARQGAVTAGPAAMDDGTTADLKINLNDIQSGKAQNIKILDGDTIYVPKALRIFVAGQVRQPGPFPYDESMTVFEAISLAGGVTEKGSNSRVSVRRLIKGQMKEIDVKPSDKLQPGDQVNVKPRRL